MDKGRILIVDDEEQLRSLIRRIVALEGFCASEAATFADARRNLEKDQVDVILCDVKLPDVTHSTAPRHEIFFPSGANKPA